MMLSDSGKTRSLLKRAEMLSKILGREGRSIVAHIFKGNDSIVTTMSFKFTEGSKGCMGCKDSLKFNMDISRGMVSEDASTNELFLVRFLSTRGKQAAFLTTDEMVNRNFLSWKKVVFSKDSPVGNSNSLGSGSCTGTLLGIEAGSALGDLNGTG